jgi:hypothetical protein
VRFLLKNQTKNFQVIAQKFGLKIQKLEDPELKSNPALIGQKQRRNKKNIQAKRNSETLFFLKRKIGTLFFSETKRNETNCETERNGTKTFLQGPETKRNETENLRNGTKRNGKNNNVSQTLKYRTNIVGFYPSVG